ncbi:MAG: hypothetical protein JNJ58_00615 [Chitinophagaceae bacterium]|nr:hypothetical protein [Chitinophagaceae bacterium]
MFCLLILITGWIACDTEPELIPPPAEDKDLIIASIPQSARSEISPVVLEEQIINEESMIVNHRLEESTKIDRDSSGKAGFALPERAGPASAEYQYYIVDTLHHSPEANILLIGRSYAYENVIWLCIYNKHKQLTEHREVYYDNTEGMLEVASEIRNNKIHIYTANEFEVGNKKDTVIYRIDREYKLVKVSQ